MTTESPLGSLDRDAARPAVSWDSTLGQRSPLFWPIASAIAAIAEAIDGETESAFPQPETIDAALAGFARVRFVRQRPVSRRRRRPRELESMYDARIVDDGCVPTRPGSWHDLMNALVWATFPLAKRALHERQRTLVVPAASGESARRPRELDALALVDEGGVIVVSKDRSAADEDELARWLGAGEATALVFGHAIYEGIVLGWPPPLASAVCVVLEDAASTGLETIDERFAALLGDRAQLAEPRAMLRLRADQRLVPRALR